ncbi:hypothetical protein IV75_GL001051 [Carnobacterium maltaromaticum]|nr:hypothetical protein IV75_GL001051 [Carnobacterium maltaromaticum]
MKFRGDKKRHIKFPYSSVEPERTQRAFDGVKPAQRTFYIGGRKCKKITEHWSIVSLKN